METSDIRQTSPSHLFVPRMTFSLSINSPLNLHNFIRPHMGLDGLTPVEKCGIKIVGNNNWITLIQNATKMPKM